MSRILLLLLLCYSSRSYAFFENSQHVSTFDPTKLKELRYSDSEELWIVQLYNGTSPDANNATVVFEQAAKSMRGYVKCAALDITQHMFLAFVVSTAEFPSYLIFGFYKHTPEVVTVSTNVKSVLDEASRSLQYLFQERGLNRYTKTKFNYELGFEEFEVKINKSLSPWGVIIYDSNCEKCMEFAKVWDELVVDLHEKIKFASVTTHEGTEDFPMIKYYPKGNKNSVIVEMYSGPMHYDDVHKYFLENIEAREVRQITKPSTAAVCMKRNYCIFAFLPKLDQCNVACRKETLSLLTKFSEQNKKQSWVWLWSEFEAQKELDKAFGLSTSGQPAIVVVDVLGCSLTKIELDSAIVEDNLNDVVAKIRNGKAFDVFINVEELPDLDVIEEWQSSKIKDEL